MKYRDFMTLTDEEIIFIIKDIFKTEKVDNVVRNNNSQCISCDIYIMEEYPDYVDTLDLTIPSWDFCGISTHDFLLTSEEELKWKQWLLAKGCDYRLKDNPYLE